jgi:hypothetical protein
VVDLDLLVPDDVFAELEEALVRATVQVDLLAAVEQAEEFHCRYLWHLELALEQQLVRKCL